MANHTGQLLVLLGFIRLKILCFQIVKEFLFPKKRSKKFAHIPYPIGLINLPHQPQRFYPHPVRKKILARMPS